VTEVVSCSEVIAVEVGTSTVDVSGVEVAVGAAVVVTAVCACTAPA